MFGDAQEERRRITEDVSLLAQDPPTTFPGFETELPGFCKVLS